MTDKVKNGVKESLKSVLKSDKIGLIVALIAMICVFNSLTGGNYTLKINVINILVSCAIVGLVTIGESHLLICGQVDLSPGAVAAFSGVLISILLGKGMNMWLAILIVIAAGALIGFINASLVNGLKLEAFIATLATMSIVRGFAYIICGGKAVFINNSDFLKLGSGRILDIPIPVIIFVVLFITFIIVLAKTKFGRSVYMVGGNPTASRLAGINEKMVKVKLFMLTSALAALGGILLAARMSSGQPTASEGLEFDAVTAAVLGGIAMTGGKGSLFGALIGLAILQGFNNGLLMMNVPSFWQIVARGLLLVVALTFDYIRNRKSK